MRNIEWFGGEPLISFGMLKDVTNELNRFFKRNKISYFYGATTNAYLLDNEKIDFMLASGFKFFQITLDGNKDTHDKQRPLRDGSPTWETIFNNLVVKRTLKQTISML